VAYGHGEAGPPSNPLGQATSLWVRPQVSRVRVIVILRAIIIIRIIIRIRDVHYPVTVLCKALGQNLGF
jgi:hypothetical protein